MTITLRPRLLKVRPAHLETPLSYFHRLCETNYIDAAWLHRRIVAGTVRNCRGILDAIHALGGPEHTHWHRSHHYAMASKQIHDDLISPTRNRWACLRCTHGQHVKTYDHARNSFCRKHGSWVATYKQRMDVMTPDLWKAEMVARRLVASRQANAELLQFAWELVRDHRFLLDGREHWRILASLDRLPHVVPDVDDRLAFFPHTVKVMALLSHPQFPLAVQAGRYDRNISRSHLTAALERRHTNTDLVRRATAA